jgi:hypothetical protein
MVTEDHKISLAAGTKLPQNPRFNPLWKWYKLAEAEARSAIQWYREHAVPHGIAIARSAR